MFKTPVTSRPSLGTSKGNTFEKKIFIQAENGLHKSSSFELVRLYNCIR